MSIHYTVKPLDPAGHIFEVVLEISDPDPAGQRLSLPAWIPGSYMIRDFARNIVEIHAESDSGPVSLVKLDKAGWQAPEGCTSLRVKYTVYAWDLSVRAAHLDQTHGFFNGTSLFLCVEGQRDKPCELLLERAGESSLQDWQVATAMPSMSVDDAGFGRYRTEDYDELVDHPVEMGRFERAVFDACGVEHELVLTGRYRTDMDRICQDLKRICEAQIRFFGEPAPMERYVFLVMVVGNGYGGLEHRASTSLLIRRENLPLPGEKTVSDSYLEFLGLCSHEYFHTWNVKRIRPAAFMPLRLSAEVHTPLLWAFEGITSYYDDLFLYRCGLIDAERYLRLLAKTITRVYQSPGRHRQSVAESSFDAWTKFYKQDENAPNAIVSYYAKGSLVALCLDALIRMHTDHQRSLDDVMQALWKRWNDRQLGVEDGTIQQLAAEIAGEDLDGFFQLAVDGVEDLPLEAHLSAFGVRLEWRAAESSSDTGGSPAKRDAALPWLGARFRQEKDLVVSVVLDDSPARRAGWSAGDTLVALDGLRMSLADVDKLLARCTSGDVLDAHLFRRDELLHLPVTLGATPKLTCVLLTEEQHRLPVRFA